MMPNPTSAVLFTVAIVVGDRLPRSSSLMEVRCLVNLADRLALSSASLMNWSGRFDLRVWNSWCSGVILLRCSQTVALCTFISLAISVFVIPAVFIIKNACAFWGDIGCPGCRFFLVGGSVVWVVILPSGLCIG